MESEIGKINSEDFSLGLSPLERVLVRKINLLIDETAVLKANLEHYARRTNQLLPPPSE